MTTIDTSASENSATQFDALYKVLLVGDEGSGARCIFNTITDDNEFITDVGDDYKVKFFDILELKVKFEMRSREIADGYFINARGVLMVYDTSDRSAFINIRNWFSHIMSKGSPHIQVVLVGHTFKRPSNCELDQTSSNSHTFVTDVEGLELASELGIPYCAVREGDGYVEDVQSAFLRLYQAMGSELEYSRLGTMGLLSYCAVS